MYAKYREKILGYSLIMIYHFGFFVKGFAD